MHGGRLQIHKRQRAITSLLSVAKWNTCGARQNKKASTHLVDHVSKQALDFIRVNLLLAAQANGGRELGGRDPGPTGGRVYIWSHSARNEDLPKQIPETGVMRSFKGEIDSPFDEFILTLLQCLVKSVQVAPLYALG